MYATMRSFLFIVFSSFFIFVECDPILEIPNGKIEGRTAVNANNKTFYVFQGIPFAKPPINELRFEPPQEPENWEGVLDVQDNNVECPQIFRDLHEFEKEDCLLLKVYTPQLQTAQNDVSLPVMVFLFGGSLVAGSSGFDGTGPHYFMDHGVILVTINYRLGAFGFMSTQDEVLHGNVGFKDQRMALQWVNKNIKYFGGDPSKVILFGASSGAASASYHVLNKKSEGLFSGAILHSCTALVPVLFQSNPRQIAFDFGKIIDPSIDISNTSSQKLLEVLKKAPLLNLKDAASSMSERYSDHKSESVTGGAWAAVKEQPHEDAFLTDNMYETLESGNFHRVPTIMGFTDEEEIDSSGDIDSMKAMDQNLQRLVLGDMHITSNDTRNEVASLIRRFYVGDDGLFENNIGASVRQWSNTVFNRPILKTAELQSKYADVYFYQLSYSGEIANIPKAVEGAGRVQHGAEHAYLFHSEGREIKNFPPSDILTHERLITLWTNFAKYLDPTPEIDPLFDNGKWPKIEDPENIVYVNINTTLSIETNPKNEMYKFWTDLYDKYAVPPYDSY